jgi:serine/threonine protein phosphatase 1
MSITFSDTLNPGDLVAIGDVHGRFDLLVKMVDWLKGSGARVIFLGDLIDRGGEDLKVLDLVKQLLDDPDKFGLESVTAIKGNHEQMFVNMALYNDTSDTLLWIQNGGNFCQREEMIQEHLDWVKELPLMVRADDTIFVHAGLLPGQNPEVTLAKNPETLLWIRAPFLVNGPKLGAWTSEVKQVVHGHSIESTKPVVKNQRVNIDTGAFMTGLLTAYNVTGNTFHQVQGEPDLKYGKL